MMTSFTLFVIGNYNCFVVVLVAVVFVGGDLDAHTNSLIQLKCAILLITIKNNNDF